jgi:5-methylcytosine-specific restriction endonuclease McrA
MAKKRRRSKKERSRSRAKMRSVGSLREAFVVFQQAEDRLWLNRAHGLNRRARKAGVVGTVSPSALKRIVLRDQSSCVYCGAYLDYSVRGTLSDVHLPSFDHVVRLVDGGPHLENNVVCACAKCNGEQNDVMQAAAKERVAARKVALAQARDVR